MSKIIVDGEPYRVVVTLPFSKAGLQAKTVMCGDEERVVVKREGAWTWWTARDRLGCVLSGMKPKGLA